MEICGRRGALGRWLHSIYNRCTKGFLQRTVTVLTTEILGAKIAETAAPVIIGMADSVGQSYIPLYRQLPLITSSVALIGLARKTSNTGIAAITITTTLALYIYPMKELEEITTQIAGTVLTNIAQLFATIGGGYLGIAFIYPEEKFADYRENMVAHALTGRAFELSVVTYNNPILQILRTSVRAILQMVAYNRKPLWNSCKTLIRREPKHYGIIIPTLTRLLFARYDTLDPKKLSGPVLDQLMKVVKDFLQSNSSESVTLIKELTAESLIVLSRSIISYHSRIITSESICSSIRCLQLCKDNELKKAITLQIETALRAEFPRTETLRARVLNIAGRNLIWNEQNLDSLKVAITELLKDLGIFLVGEQPYPKEHLAFIQDLIQIHLKPFLFFAITNLLDKSSARKPKEPYEELELAAILQQIVWKSAVDPILPTFLTSTLCKTTTIVIKAGVGTVHTLQGFRPNDLENPEASEDFLQVPLEDVERPVVHGKIHINEEYIAKPDSLLGDDDYETI